MGGTDKRKLLDSSDDESGACVASTAGARRRVRARSEQSSPVPECTRSEAGGESDDGYASQAAGSPARDDAQSRSGACSEAGSVAQGGSEGEGEGGSEGEGESEGEGDSDLEFDGTFSDSTFGKSCYKGWQHGEHMKYGGGCGSASLMQARLTHPRARVSICKKHTRLSLRHDSDCAAPWTGSHRTFPLKRIIDSQSSFAARRFVADRDTKLAQVLAKYDVICCDEAQDLSSGQEMRLILQATSPVIMVGDRNQDINEFRHHISEFHCEKRAPCVFPVEPVDRAKSQDILWYSTYRLDPLTVAFIEDTCGIKMVSRRTDAAVVRWSTTLTAPHTLVMARKNENVIRLAVQYRHAHIRVLSGARLAVLLRTASVSGGQHGMPKLARTLQHDGQLHAVLKMLVDQDITLKELKDTPTFAVSSLHGLKGYETDATALCADLLEAARKETASGSADTCERNCLFVALSRHKHSLTLLLDVKPPCEPAPASKVQTTLEADLSGLSYTKPRPHPC